MMMNRPHAAVAAALLCVLAGGCVSLGRGGKPVVTRYTVDYPAPAASAAPLPVVIQLLPMRSAANYDRPDIVYRDGQYRLDAYSYRRWSTHPARMIRDLIERDLIASGAFAAVIEGPSTLAPDFVVDGVVEQVEESGDCGAHLSVRILLARQKERLHGAPLFQRVYAAEVPCLAGDGSGDAFAAAMSRAMAEVSARVRADLVETIAADLSGNPR